MCALADFHRHPRDSQLPLSETHAPGVRSQHFLLEAHSRGASSALVISISDSHRYLLFIKINVKMRILR